MGEVYRQAKLVYACIGPYTNHRKSTFNIFDCLDKDEFVMPTENKRTKLLQKALRDCGTIGQDIDNVLDGLTAFDNRLYGRHL
jgi:hypothetical protein